MRKIILISSLSLCLVAVFAAQAKELQHHAPHKHIHQHKSTESGGVSITTDMPSLYHLESRWVRQDGKKMLLRELSGKIQVVAMVYTSCQYACPIITKDMQKIEKQIPEKYRKQVGFALFSIDPQQDTPEHLKSYAEKRGLDLTHWSLFTAQNDDIRELAALLGVRYKKTSNLDYSHSNLITVLSPQGVIIYQQIGLNKDSTETVQTILKNLEPHGETPGSSAVKNH